MKLSRPAQEKARSFIQEQARPLERALYAYHFAGGSPEPVLAALAVSHDRGTHPFATSALSRLTLWVN